MDLESDVETRCGSWGCRSEQWRWAAQLTRGTDRAQQSLEAVQTRLADAGRVSVLGELLAAGDVRAVWDGLDLDRRRAVVDALLTVTLLPPGRGARRLDPETVRLDWRTS